MTMWLKQSTAATVKIGPFVDSTDGVTAETALTISQADIRLSKNGGDIAQSNNVAGATHDELGYYDVPLDTTDTNTLGRLKVAVSESGALPVWADFMVAPANVWDSLFGADKLQVHVDEMTAGIITAAVIATDAIDADAVAADAIAEINATVDTAISDAALATATNLATVDTVVDAILLDTAEIGAAGAGLTALGDTRIANLDATVSSRASQTSVDDLPTNAELATALGTADDATLAAIAALSIPSANTIADTVLARGVSNVEETADTASLAALILAALESSISGTTWTIRKTGGTTFVTKTVTVDDTADPITGVT